MCAAILFDDEFDICRANHTHARFSIGLRFVTNELECAVQTTDMQIYHLFVLIATDS